MRVHILLLIGIAVGIVGCAEKEQAAPEPESKMESTEPLATESPAVDEAPADEPDTTYAQVEEWRDADLLDHMHAHAEQLDDLNFALDDDNLERAMTSAYWMSRHDTVKGLPTALQPFVDRMREAAQGVETAADLAAAREAAQEIGEACQGCHAAAEVSIE